MTSFWKMAHTLLPKSNPFPPTSNIPYQFSLTIILFRANCPHMLKNISVTKSDKVVLGTFLRTKSSPLQQIISVLAPVQSQWNPKNEPHPPRNWPNIATFADATKCLKQMNTDWKICNDFPCTPGRDLIIINQKNTSAGFIIETVLFFLLFTFFEFSHFSMFSRVDILLTSLDWPLPQAPSYSARLTGFKCFSRLRLIISCLWAFLIKFNILK